MPGLPRRSTQTTQLLLLLLEDPTAWRYGYEISKRTGLRSGTLYPILIRLADKKWLEARWAPPEREGRPARHTYRLTAEGVLAAEAEAAVAPQRPAARLTLERNPG